VLVDARLPESGAAAAPLPRSLTWLSVDGVAWRFQSNGADYVYFTTRDDATLNAGMFFSPSGKPPTVPPASFVGHRLGTLWWSGGMDWRYMQVGTLAK
jgi:hypothetical protein